MNVYQLDDHNIQTVVNRPGVVLVSFWAPWCSACRRLGPVLEEVSCDLAGTAIIAKVHVDYNPVSRDYYKIQNIPTLLLFKNGYIVKTLHGYKTKEKLIELICAIQ